MEEGFVVGKYYEVAKLLVSLKKFFGVDVFPTFIGHGGHRPSLYEVGVLFTKDCTQMIHHPRVGEVSQEKFLMSTYRCSTAC